VLAVTILAGLTAGVCFWLGSRGGAGISLGELAAAGLNAATPAILLLGFAILVIGRAPRWTSTLCYALIDRSSATSQFARTTTNGAPRGYLGITRFRSVELERDWPHK
jgi:putative exporter of polyketide antibiotics